jgi:hypothetical protein
MSLTDSFLKDIRDLLVDIRDAIRAGNGTARQAPAQAVASDHDLDSAKGNPLAKKMPLDWGGPDFKGKKLSECPPELLDMLAERQDYFAKQNDINGEKDNNGGPKSKWDRLEASRMRGWAKRIRAGWKPAPRPSFDDAEADTITDDDIPFLWLLPLLMAASAAAPLLG